MCEQAEDYRTAALYEIRIKGHLDNRWADWFEGLALNRENNGETRLVGRVVDQAALYGVLRKVRNLGMPLVAVIQLDTNWKEAAEARLDSEHDRSEKESEP